MTSHRMTAVQTSLFASATGGYLESSARISDCGRYRYSLVRQWEQRPLVAWILCNPSTADASIDDATVRKCMGFARRWDCGGILIVNVCAFRSRHPGDLLAADDPVGPDNSREFDWLCLRTSNCEPPSSRVTRIVAGWGGALPRELRFHAETTLGWLIGSHVDVQCLGRTKGGQPRHPLMLSYSTPLEAFA